MSIKIEFDFLESKNDRVMIGGRYQFDNFNLLSNQIEQLLLLQLRKKEKDKLRFSIENRALVIFYENNEDDKQADHENLTLEDRLINALQLALDEVEKYLNYLARGKQRKAINFNVAKKRKPLKMQMILSKLASQKVILSTDSGLKICIEKTQNYANSYEEQNTTAINCRITKPELINACKAEFHYLKNGLKYVATLDIPVEFEEDILNCALSRVAVDIDFDYIENTNIERKYTGCLTGFEVAQQTELETVTEELF